MSSPLNLIHDNQPIFLSNYKPYSGIRLIVITSLAAVLIIALALTGKFNHLSQWSVSPNLWKPLTICGVGIALLSITSYIIYQAKKGLAKGKVVGSSHWKKCIVKLSVSTPPNNFICIEENHIDISGLDERGNGVARLFFKSPQNAVITGIVSAIFMPVYVSIVIFYNLIRLIVIPFYIITRMIRESSTNEHKFTFLDIPKQMILSVARVIQAPFYGIAMFFASLYTLIDPLNAIKLGSAIEYDWNGQVPLQNAGIWMVGRKIFKDWKWEGGGDPDKLGRNGFYFAGSWQPYRDVQCVNWHIIEITGVNGAIVKEEQGELSFRLKKKKFVGD